MTTNPPVVGATTYRSRGLVRRQESGRAVLRVSAPIADAIDDPETLKDWSDEELRRGRRLGPKGKFNGPDPKVIPSNVHREMLRRQLSQAEVLLTQNLTEAVRLLGHIVSSPASEDKDRLKAAQLIMDRVMGKPKESVTIDQKQPMFVGILAGGIVPGDPLEDMDIIDVESDELVWED